MRALPGTSPFAADDGSADPALAAELARHQEGESELSAVVTALAGTRVLVAILPHGREITPQDEAAGAKAQAAVIGVGTGDGRGAMPVFTSVAALAAWRADARPVPTPAAQAAQGALEAGWEVLVLDPGGPVSVRLPRPAVVALAQGSPWRPAVSAGAVADEVAAEIRAALAGVPELAGVAVEPGERAEVVVVLVVRPGLDRAALDGVVARVNEALTANATVAERVDSLELRLRS